MSILGLRSTADFTVDGQRPKNWREGILKLYPNGNAPLTALTALMKERKVDDPEYSWYTRLLTNRRLLLTADVGGTSGDTTLTVAANGATSRGARELKQGDVLYLENTGELVRVTADPASDTAITVSRGFAGTSITAIDFNGTNVNPNVLVVGSAYEEGSLSPSGVQLDPVKQYNYTQIFRTAVEFTRTASKTRLRTGEQVKQARADALEMIGMDLERAFLLGSRSEGTLNGRPLRTTGGILSFMAAGNKVAAGATTDMATLEGYLKDAFAYGSDEKIGFCGNKAMLVLQQIIRLNSTYQIGSNEKIYGMNIQRLTCPFGDLLLKRHPLFNNVPGGLNAGASAYVGMDSWLLVIDQANLTYTYIDDISYKDNRQVNDMDGMKAEYLGEVGLEIHHPDTFYLLKGLTAAAVDS